jgi:hypothetical protein
MLNEAGKTAPAPWVPFTRAGCDVGGFSVANIEFERLPDDVTTFYGAGSPTDTTVHAQLNSSSPATQQQPNTDYLGIAIHCGLGSPLCNNSFAATDPLVDEPGGYTGFKGLFGNINVQPVISPSGPVKDLDGNVIADAFGRPGFPNLFSPLAMQSLGYAATMMEAGVQVVYLYIADAHDNRSGSGTFGPGEAGYVAQLAGGACVNASDCISVGAGFAWNHGDFQRDITRSWFGIVGPGIRNLGRSDEILSDHTDVRPTLIALVGLTDDYAHDGRVLAEWIDRSALPAGIRGHQENFTELASVYKQLNAPLGTLGRASLVWANRSITGTDRTYARYLSLIADITAERDALVGTIKTVLDRASFGHQTVDEFAEDGLGDRAQDLINRVKELAKRDRDDRHDD